MQVVEESAGTPWLPRAAPVGRFLVFVMSFVTLSFLVTTPEVWVPAPSGPKHGFPLLSGAGRLVLKDATMMGAAFVTVAYSAQVYLRRRNLAETAVRTIKEPAFV